MKLHLFKKMKKIKAYNLICTCDFCPTQFEFEDEFNNKYYFRLRWGCWKLCDITDYENWKELAYGNFGDNLTGVCTKDEFKKLLKSEGIKIIEC